MLRAADLALESWPLERCPRKAGKAIAARMPMIRITTRSSISVKPLCPFLMLSTVSQSMHRSSAPLAIPLARNVSGSGVVHDERADGGLAGEGRAAAVRRPGPVHERRRPDGVGIDVAVDHGPQHVSPVPARGRRLCAEMADLPHRPDRSRPAVDFEAGHEPDELGPDREGG